MGLWAPEDTVLVDSGSEEHESRYSSSEILSSSSRVLYFPPWMGGTKLSQRPSMRPIWYRSVSLSVCGEWKLNRACQRGRRTSGVNKTDR